MDLASKLTWLTLAISEAVYSSLVWIVLLYHPIWQLKWKNVEKAIVCFFYSVINVLCTEQ